VDRKHRGAELGMLLGIFVGGGVSTLLFAWTGNAMSFIAVGIGLAVGLAIGAGTDSSQVSAKA